MSQTQIRELLLLTHEESLLILRLSEISRKRVALLGQDQPNAKAAAAKLRRLNEVVVPAPVPNPVPDGNVIHLRPKAIRSLSAASARWMAEQRETVSRRTPHPLISMIFA
jgi:hypothetical protein